MRGGFDGRCYACGGWGHRAFECASNQFGQTNRVERQSPEHGEEEEGDLTIYHLPAGQVTEALFGAMLGPPPASGNNQPQPQPQQQPQEEQDRTVASKKRLREPDRRILDPSTIPILDTRGAVRPRGGQAGRGALPGARGERRQPGARVLGDNRVGRANRSRGQGLQHLQRRGRFASDDDDDGEDAVSGPGTEHTQGQDGVGRARGQGNMAQEQGRAESHASRPVPAREGTQGPPTHPAEPRFDVIGDGVRASNIGGNQVLSLVDDLLRTAQPGQSHTLTYTRRPAAGSPDAPVIIDRSVRRSFQMDEDRRDGPASSEVARDRLLRAMAVPGDPFAFNANLGQTDRRPPRQDEDLGRE